MKKGTALVLMCIIVFTSFTAFASGESYTISLDDAIQMAIKDNPQFVSADTKIADAKRQLVQAKKDQNDYKKIAVKISSGITMVAAQQGYYVSQAQIGVKSAELEKQQAIDKLAYDVTQKYYNVKLSEALVESAKNAYNLALNNKNIMDTQFALGLVAELDVKNAAFALSQAKVAWDNYIRNADLAKKNLLISLQIDDEDTELILTDSIEYEDFNADLNADTQAAMESRYDIYRLKSAFEQSEKYLAAATLKGKTSATYSSANQAMVQSKYTYTNTKKLIALSINSSYNDIIRTKDNLKLAEEKLALCRQEYEVALLQHEIGMITNVQLTFSLDKITTAEIELENAKLNYKLAVKKYGYEITIGL